MKKIEALRVHTLEDRLIYVCPECMVEVKDDSKYCFRCGGRFGPLSTEELLEENCKLVDAVNRRLLEVNKKYGQSSGKKDN